MSLKVIIFVTFLFSQCLKSSRSFDNRVYAGNLENSRVRVRDSKPCVIGTRYRMRRCKKKARTRNYEATNQKVTATKEVLIVKIFMNNLCVHCTVPAKFKSQLVIFHMCLLLTQLFCLRF